MVSDRVLELYLDGILCGVVTQTSTGNLTFAYDEAYRRRPNATPLSLSMPLSAVTHKKRAVLAFIQGLLPDSTDALRAIARRYSVSPTSPFGMLEHVGEDVAGAVQLVSPGQAPSDRDQSRTVVRAVSDAEVSTMLAHAISEYTEGVPFSDVVGRFSLAGAQPKIALFKTAAGWAVPEDATPTTHILKPVAGTFRRIDVVERMTMHAAAFLGNEVAHSESDRIGEFDVFVSTRYDRSEIDGVWHRLHQEDFCQALSVTPSKKYQHRDGCPGTADIAWLIHSLPFESDRRQVGERFYRALVFNVVAGCTDAHAKNYSLMLDGASVRLAPLYDLATYAPYWDGAARLESAMNVNGEYNLAKIGEAQLVDVAKRFGIAAADATDIVRSTRRGMIEAFESAREAVAIGSASAREVADAAIAGLKQLPLAAG